uniref:Putative conserved secreted protein n=1 Tax=Rhipicephalus microplus TaxID=6941 RepID=A0A6G5A6M4_RHIMP
MRKLLCVYILVLLAVELVHSQEPASCLDRRVLLNTGKEYLKSIVAKLIPKYLKDYISGLPKKNSKVCERYKTIPNSPPLPHFFFAHCALNYRMINYKLINKLILSL